MSRDALRAYLFWLLGAVSVAVLGFLYQRRLVAKIAAFEATLDGADVAGGE